jgi:uncharacterized iron-regulated protein
MSKATSFLTPVTGIGIGLAVAAAPSAASQQGTGGLSAHAAMASGKEVMAGMRDTRMISPDDGRSFSQLLSALDGKRVVFVGKSHDRYDHHLSQLAVIRGLHERRADLAVGMEFFQEPFQPYLDEYVAGKIDEKTLLGKPEYFERWRFDYRLYRDILTYARDNGIPLVALNAPTELVARVSKAGIGGLKPEERARLPRDLKPADPAYRDRLRPIFAMHGKVSEERFGRFVDVQLLWDEHMARVAGDYLEANPAKQMVVLAGSGHVVYPDAIPGRFKRIIGGDVATLATGSRERFAGGNVDYLFAERDIALDPPGRLGMELARADSGVSIRQVRPDGPAENAGLRPGDRMRRINGERIYAIEDVRLALLDRKPGETVRVEVELGGESNSGEEYERLVCLL